MGLNGTINNRTTTVLDRPGTNAANDYTVCMRILWHIGPVNDAVHGTENNGAGLTIYGNTTTNFVVRTLGTSFVTLNIPHVNKGVENWIWIAATVVTSNSTINGWVDDETASIVGGVSTDGYYKTGSTNWISHLSLDGNLDTAGKIADLIVYDRLLSKSELDCIRFSDGRLVSLEGIFYRRKFRWAAPGTAINSEFYPLSGWTGTPRGSFSWVNGTAYGTDIPTCEENPYGLRRRPS